MSAKVSEKEVLASAERERIALQMLVEHAWLMCRDAKCDEAAIHLRNAAKSLSGVIHDNAA